MRTPAGRSRARLRVRGQSGPNGKKFERININSMGSPGLVGLVERFGKRGQSKRFRADLVN